MGVGCVKEQNQVTLTSIMSVRKKLWICCLTIALVFLSFTLSGPLDPEEKITQYYRDQLTLFQASIEQFQKGVIAGQSESQIRSQFLETRIAYKKIELFAEYFFELDVSKLNGPSIEFIEEEDPTAQQEPQGLQMIEIFLYPHYLPKKKDSLLLFIDKLYSHVQGFSRNASNFTLNNYAWDAATEEIVRILCLGITGFDSPLAQNSIKETDAALNGVEVIVLAYQNLLRKEFPIPFNSLVSHLRRARIYLKENPGFNGFDRMYFITTYLNPISQLLGSMKKKLQFPMNPIRFSVISREGTLFNMENLQPRYFLGDDLISDSKIVLGRRLFYDQALSVNGQRSCASCHQPEKGFTDGLATAAPISGHGRLPRNTPTLWNAFLQRNLFHDSRQISLDRLILEVMSNEKEMNSGVDKAVIAIKKNPVYIQLFRKAYPQAEDINGEILVNAISMYLRTLLSYNSRFDQYIRGNKNKLTPAEIKGFNLFSGKARCATCHFIPLFNGSKPPSFLYQETEVLGVPADTNKAHPQLDSDLGRYTTTQQPFHRFAFKTPTLRNISLTAPYMHNGVFTTLSQVMEFYNNGGGKGLHIAPSNQTLPFDKLGLSTAEVNNIISFMQTLNDTSGYSFKRITY